jgi:hypothetical protein
MASDRRIALEFLETSPRRRDAAAAPKHLAVRRNGADGPFGRCRIAAEQGIGEGCGCCAGPECGRRDLEEFPACDIACHLHLALFAPVVASATPATERIRREPLQCTIDRRQLRIPYGVEYCLGLRTATSRRQEVRNAEVGAAAGIAGGVLFIYNTPYGIQASIQHTANESFERNPRHRAARDFAGGTCRAARRNGDSGVQVTLRSRHVRRRRGDRAVTRRRCRRGSGQRDAPLVDTAPRKRTAAGAHRATPMRRLPRAPLRGPRR